MLKPQFLVVCISYFIPLQVTTAINGLLDSLLNQLARKIHILAHKCGGEAMK